MLQVQVFDLCFELLGVFVCLIKPNCKQPLLAGPLCVSSVTLPVAA